MKALSNRILPWKRCVRWGRFQVVGSKLANYIAKCDGSSWSILGSGLDYYVTAIAVSGNDVYVGGEFWSAGGKPSYHFGVWHTLLQPKGLTCR